MMSVARRAGRGQRHAAHHVIFRAASRRPMRRPSTIMTPIFARSRRKPATHQEAVAMKTRAASVRWWLHALPSTMIGQTRRRYHSAMTHIDGIRRPCSIARPSRPRYVTNINGSMRRQIVAKRHRHLASRPRGRSTEDSAACRNPRREMRRATAAWRHAAGIGRRPYHVGRGVVMIIGENVGARSRHADIAIG